MYFRLILIDLVWLSKIFSDTLCHALMNMVSISTISSQSTCHSLILHQSTKFCPNRTALSIKNWRHVDFQGGGSPPSWISGVNNGLFEKPMYDCYRSSIETMALNCLVFEKIAFLHFGDGQTNRRTDGQPQRIRLNNWTQVSEKCPNETSRIIEKIESHKSKL